MKPLTPKNYELAKKFALFNFQKYAKNASWAEEYLRSHDKRIHYTLGKLGKLLYGKHSKNVSVIEIGFSPVCLILKFFLDSEELTVLDRDLRLGKKLGQDGIGFLKADLNKPFKIGKKHDVVLFNEVLEHLFCDEVELLKSMMLGLKNDGALILSTPNLNSLWNIRLIIEGKRITPTHGSVISEQGGAHIKEYSLEELKDIVSKTGHTLEFSEYADYFDTYANASDAAIKMRQKAKKASNSGAFSLKTHLIMFQVFGYLFATKSIPRLRRGLFLIIRKRKNA